jgi:glycosyltransferase involved in cell wall biosynthesis
MLPNVVCGLAWRLTGAKTCVWNQRDAGLRFCPELEQWAVRLARCFVSNSTAGADFLATTFALPRDGIRIIPNGVELAPPEADRFEWRSRLGLSSDQFVACMVANITSAKDHATLIRAWRLVVDQLPERRPVLLLAGTLTAAASSHQALAEQMQLRNHIRFLGTVNDIAGLLGGADLGVFSSAREGCPNGVLECMAAGLAVVATDIPGTRDALGSEACDQFVPVGDPIAMAERIVTLGRDVALRHVLGLANQSRIHREFSPERMYQDMLRLIAFQDGKGESAHHG